MVWSVCLSVKSHLTYGAPVRPENAVMYSADNEGVNICGDLPETTEFKSYAANDLPAVSFFSAKRQRVPNDCQQHSALPKNDAY